MKPRFTNNQRMIAGLFPYVTALFVVVFIYFYIFYNIMIKKS